jgi:hypothetical protein
MSGSYTPKKNEMSQSSFKKREKNTKEAKKRIVYVREEGEEADESELKGNITWDSEQARACRPPSK